MTRARDLADSADKDIAGTLTLDGLVVDGSATISNASGDTLTLAKGTTEPSFRIEGDANKDFVFTISGELLTLTQNDGATDIVTFDHDTKASSFFGNLGIGTSSNRNSTKLDVLGDITFGENANYYGTLAYNAGEGFLDITSGDGGFRLFKRSGPTELMRITSDGSVGINDSSPDGKLNVVSTAHNNGSIFDSGGTTQLWLRDTDAASNQKNWGFQVSGGDLNIVRANDDRASGFVTPIYIQQAPANSLVIDSGGNFGLGSTRTDRGLLNVNHVNNGHFFADPHIALTLTSATDNASSAGITYATSDSDNYGYFLGAQRTNGGLGNFILKWHDNSSGGTREVFRVDSNSNLLVGTTSMTASDTSGTGMMYANGIALRVKRESNGNGQPCLDLNNTGSDDVITLFRKDGVTVGKIGTVGTDLYIGTTDTGLRFLDSSNAIIPINTDTQSTRDDAISLGTASGRYDNIYATNGTINTSDRNEKQDIAELTEAERRVAVAAKGLLRKFRWKSAVASKGDKARTHFGIIAQDLQAAFEAEGLDAGDYAMFISSTWTDEETGEEKTRMGVRYSELLAFIIAAI